MAGRWDAVDLLRGSPHGQRPPRAPPRVGEGLQGPLPAVPDHAGSHRAPASRLGQPRAAGRDRSREGARAAVQAGHRGLRRGRLQRALPGVRVALRRGLDRADGAVRRLVRHRARLLDDEQRLHRVRLVAPAAALGRGAALRGPPGHPVLPPLWHRALLARARPTGRLPGRGGPVGLRALPGHRSGRRPPGVDHDAVDAGLQRGRGRRSRHPLRAYRCARRRTGPRAGRRGRGPALAGSGGVRDLDRAGPGGLALPETVRPAARRRQRGTRRGRRLRRHRGRLGPRPSGSGVRRGRRADRPAGGSPGPEPGRARRHVRRPGHPVGRTLREGRRSRGHRGPPQPGAAGRGGAVRAQLPPLLALRDAPPVLGQDVVVRAHVVPPGRPPAGERGHRVAPRAHQARPLRQVAGGQRGLGPLAGPVLGHAASDLALP